MRTCAATPEPIHQLHLLSPGTSSLLIDHCLCLDNTYLQAMKNTKKIPVV
jgi:hypothetical protein